MKQSKPTLKFEGDSTHVLAKGAAEMKSPVGMRIGELNGGGLLEQLLARPELAMDRSFVIQNAIEEFQELSTAHPSLTSEEYSRRFSRICSSLESSIYRQLEVERYVSNNSWLREKLQDEPWPEPAERRGSFHVIEEVGRGALSRVYLCSQPDLGHRHVVVKMARSSHYEADSLGRLRHQNIVPIFSVETDGKHGLEMLCMPFLGRSTLFDYFDEIRGNSSPPFQQLLRAARRWEQPSDRVDECVASSVIPRLEESHYTVAWIGQQLASALAHAHDRGVFHGDIKPSNILLTRNETPLLMDFNLSGNIAISAAAIGGTLPYMPPEQLRAVVLSNGLAAQYDQRSDIYSLGAVLYEALTGRTPFAINSQSDGQAASAKRLLELQQIGIKPISSLNHSVPKGLATLVESCLQFHPADRVQSAKELESLLKGELAPWRLFKSRLAANRTKVLLSACLSVTLCFGGGVALWQQPPKHVRLLQNAIQHRDVGRYANAEQTLTAALAHKPDFSDAQFELARTALAQHSFLSANEHLLKLEKMDPGARSAAYMAYCFNAQGNHAAAVPWYLLAMERGGETPEVLNNLSFSYENGSSILSPRDERTASHKYLTKALELSPTNPTVQINCIRLAIQRFREDGVPIPDALPQVCRELLKSCPDCASAYDRAATLFAILAPENPALREEGVELLIRATGYRLGPDARSIRNLPLWAPYRDHPRVASLLNQLEQGTRPVAGSRLPGVVEPQSLTVDRRIAK